MIALQGSNGLDGLDGIAGDRGARVSLVWTWLCIYCSKDILMQLVGTDPYRVLKDRRVKKVQQVKMELG